MAGSPQEVMHREMRVRHGDVPDTIAGLAVDSGHHRLIGDEFLLREAGFACHYRSGEGLTVRLDDPSTTGLLDLFLAGTVHSAVAAINGLLPVHASAVAVDGRAIAFTGDPGAGKSTTAAALRQRGLPIVADDTLVLDPTTSPPNCLPGHKRLKLWPDSLDLTGLSGLELVSEDYRKYFATEEPSEIADILPLGAIVALQVGDEVGFHPVRGAERIAILDDDHYTALHHAAANGHGPRERLTAIVKVANSVPVFRFVRPMDPDRFEETVDFLLDAVSGISSR